MRIYLRLNGSTLLKTMGGSWQRAQARLAEDSRPVTTRTPYTWTWRRILSSFVGPWLAYQQRVAR